MGMIPYISGHVKQIWDAWNLRGALLLSLSLQALLISLATFRKRASKARVIILIWITYLLADWAASFAVGLISKSQLIQPGSNHNGDLLAFWAPFLLLHLGGPDTITSFSLEDNELWLRHLLGLIFQVIAVAYVFYQSLPNKLWMPISLVFLSGIIKYGERTRSLYLASRNGFRDSMHTKPDPGPNYAKLMEEYSSKREANLPIQFIKFPEHNTESRSQVTAVRHMDDIEVVQEARHFFETFKGLLVDKIFSFLERNESREFFHRRSAKDTLRLLEVELNFFYDGLYTKVVVVWDKFGYLCRFICFSSVQIALALFFFMDKDGFERFDVKVTYILLLGAIALDVIALLQLIFSDWTLSALKNLKKHSVLAAIFRKYLALKKSTWSDSSSSLAIRFLAWLKRCLFRRWSESISGYNLMHYAILERPQKIQTIHDHAEHLFSKIIVLMGLKDFLDHMRYSSRTPFTKELWSFIHQELLHKSVFAKDPEYTKRIYSARGDWVLQDGVWGKLLPFVVEFEYDESLILWHVATDLCYATESNHTEERHFNQREFCKTLSDYMLYLLVVQPNMISSVVGIGWIRFQDTCAEAKKFLAWKELPRGKEGSEASKCILAVNTTLKPVIVKGNMSKSVLFDASRLAKELRKFEDQKWEIMSKVWVELLSYAASHCGATAHAHQLSKGGELATFVWLLMAHFGLVEQFHINHRVKLITGT